MASLDGPSEAAGEPSAKLLGFPRDSTASVRSSRASFGLTDPVDQLTYRDPRSGEAAASTWLPWPP